MMTAPVSRVRRRHESGFAMLLIFVLAAGIAISLLTQLPRVCFETQRNREEMLIDRGEQYKRAIGMYARKFGRYPAKMEDLDNTNGLRFLRKHYIDPMTGKEEWRLIHSNGMTLTDSLIKKSTVGPDGKPLVGPDGKPVNSSTTTASGSFSFGGTGSSGGSSSNGMGQQASGMNVDPGNSTGTATDPNAPPEVNQAVRARPSDRRMGIGQGGAAPADPSQQNSQQGTNYQQYPSQQYPNQQVQNQQYPAATDPNQAAYQQQSGQFGSQPQANAPQQAYSQPGQFGSQPQANAPQQAYSQPGQFGSQPQANAPQQGYPQPGQAPVGIPYPGQPNTGYPGQVPTGIPGMVPVQPGATYQQPGIPQQYQQQPNQPQQNGQPSNGFSPITGAGSPVAPGNMQGMGTFNPGQGGQNSAAQAIQQQLMGGQRQVPSSFNNGGMNMGGGIGIAGVASKFKGPSIKIYAERKKYQEWEFVYDPKQDAMKKMGAAMQGGNNNTTGGLGSTQSGGGFGSSGQSSFSQSGSGFGQSSGQSGFGQSGSQSGSPPPPPQN